MGDAEHHTAEAKPAPLSTSEPTPSNASPPAKSRPASRSVSPATVLKDGRTVGDVEHHTTELLDENARLKEEAAQLRKSLEHPKPEPSPAAPASSSTTEPASSHDAALDHSSAPAPTSTTAAPEPVSSAASEAPASTESAPSNASPPAKSQPASRSISPATVLKDGRTVGDVEHHTTELLDENARLKEEAALLRKSLEHPVTN